MSTPSNAEQDPEVNSSLVVEEADESQPELPEKKRKAGAKKGEPEDELEGKAVKKTKGGKSTKAAKAEKAKGEKSKRGPARPYRKLPQETLDIRIQKLQKRIDRTTAQAEEGKTFLTKYTREQAFRAAEAASA